MALFGAKKKLGEQLIDAGLLTPEKLELALQEQQTTKARLGETLIAMGLMTAESFGNFFSTTMGIPTATAEDLKNFDPKVLEVVGDDLIRKHQVLPYAFDYDNMFGAKGTFIAEIHLDLGSIGGKFFGRGAAKATYMETSQRKVDLHKFMKAYSEQQKLNTTVDAQGNKVIEAKGIRYEKVDATQGGN